VGMSKPTDVLRGNSLKGQEMYGWVVDNNDPKKKGRVKIRVPQLHRTIPDDDLPWAMPKATGQPGAGGGVGAWAIPAEGSKVSVNFDQDDPHNLKFGRSITTDDVAKDNELRNDPDYPFVSGHVDEAGNMVRTNTKEGKVEAGFTHVSGSSVLMDNDGNVYIFAAKNVFFGCKGDMELVAQGTIKMHATGSMSLKGSTISQNGGDGAATVKAVAARKRPTVDKKKGRTDL
jgi:Type VI secretion system/phage-baseplate injector OB domain